MPKRCGNLARALGAELMARFAAAGLEDASPLRLALHARVYAVARRTGAGKLTLVRHAQQRKPIPRGEVLCCRARTGSDNGGEVERVARIRRHFWRIDQTVATHPHAIPRLGEGRDQVAAAIVGDDDLHELCREVACLRNHPDASLRAVSATHDAADVVGVYGGCLRDEPTGHKNRRRNGRPQRRHGSSSSCGFDKHAMPVIIWLQPDNGERRR